ncbi:glycosyltransferase [Chthonobacter rhizosphaerae]|uniref:glycosyltransferase n=1 Tax=Chthonobacter rhizosphaerae TaxID=2735553 RepID=UPI0015EF3F69|nr:glycosyltransferase [Chthonobacter rhizosphaerae]
MKVAFDAEKFTERGTTVANFDYAAGCARMGIEPVILYERDGEHIDAARRRFEGLFDLIPYASRAELARIVRENRCDVYYKLKFDYNDLHVVEGVPNMVHCAFDFDHPHGDVYAYVSEWLSDHVSNGRRPFVPHIVELPEPQRDHRAEWGIPEDALVVGRYGGYRQFDVDFAHQSVARALEGRPDIWFVFVNTEPFIRHERVLFKGAVVDPQAKSDYIATCDVMLHARSIGETFGLSIAEFAYHNRPFLCWIGGRDRNHLRMQSDKSFIYRDGADLTRKLLKLRREDCRRQGGPLRSFRSEAVMPQFRDVFLSGSKPWSTEPSGRVLQLRRKVKNYYHDHVDTVGLIQRIAVI